MAERRHIPTTVVAWLFVAAQFALIGLMVFAPRDAGFDAGAFGRAAGMALMIMGAALGAWSGVYLGRGLTPSPLPNGATELVVAGPYKWIRHPMYVAVMLFMAGVAMRSGSWFVVAVLIGLIGLFNVKARWEEVHLQDAFAGYTTYIKSTPRFIPLVASSASSLTSNDIPEETDNKQ